MLAETIEVLAKITGVDLISGVLGKIDGSFAKMAEDASLASTKAEEAAAKLDAAFLATASGADAMSLASAQAQVAQERLSVATQEQAAAEQELVARTEEMNAVDDQNAASMERLAAASDALSAAQKKTAMAAKEAADAEARLQAVTDAASGANVTAAREQAALADAQVASTVKSSEATAANMAKAKTAAFGAAAVVAGISYESIKSAVSFQTLTQRLVTTAGESQSALGSIRSGIMQVAQQTGSSANDLAKSMYTVEAAGFDAAHGGLDVLKASTEGAKLEGSDFGTVANAVTDILKDYHKGAGDAATMTSQLVAAVSVGKANFQSMSAAMSNVLPLASAVHIKFNDVAGVLAEMTAHGMTAQRASQNIAMALRSLEGPSKAMVKEWKDLGITTDQVTQSLSTRGLGGTLDWLAKTAAAGAPKIGQTYAGALKATIGTAAGLNVALMTTGENSKDTAKAIATIGAASQDANGHVKGFAQLQQTAGYQMEALKNSIVNTGIAIGTALLPAVTSIAKAIGNVVTPIMKWVQQHQALVSTAFKVAAALLLLVGAVKMVTTVVEIFEGVMALMKANPWVLAITALVLILIYAYTHFKTFREIVNEVAKFLGGVFKGAWDIAAAAIKAFSPVWDAMVKAVKAIVKWFDDNVLTWLKSRMAEFSSWWHQHSQQILSIWNAIWDLIKLAVKIWWDGYMKPTLTIISAVWHTVWGAIKDSLKMTWDFISNIITMAMHWIMNTISLVLDIITGKWGKVWGDLKKLVGDALHDVVKTIGNLTSNFGTLLWDAGKNVINGLISGIKSMIGGIGNVMGDVGHAIRSFLPFSPAKRGPLSGSGSPDIAGRKIGSMVAAGLTNSVPEIETATKKAIDMAARGLKKSQGLGIGLSSLFTVGGGFGPAGLAGGGGGAVQIRLEIHDNMIMNDRDIDALVQKIEKRLATVTLPSGGYRSRF